MINSRAEVGRSAQAADEKPTNLKKGADDGAGEGWRPAAGAEVSLTPKRGSRRSGGRKWGDMKLLSRRRRRSSGERAGSGGLRCGSGEIWDGNSRSRVFEERFGERGISGRGEQRGCGAKSLVRNGG
ncbi:uncharacterized protein A4U43_C07F640 [Asparagus officinalis]|uniref:Uncharacterized protein n=1 Tax=Asparagus officinalis TaxID=4686 RepID=A0A5P1E8G6_ASPOF|nr:uncharacterized protein A4U43_C07F640 [Asparagus officinalis]